MNVMARKTSIACAIGVMGVIVVFLAAARSVRQKASSMLTYAVGDSGGCSFRDRVQAPLRQYRLLQSLNRARNEVRVVEQAPDGFRRWETPLGPLWSAGSTDVAFAVGEQLAGVYTEGKMALGPGDVVLDCGANVGDFVRTCLNAGVAKVVAIEPSPHNIEALRRGFANEIARGRVVIVPKGVWHEDSTLTMAVHDNSLLDSFVMRDRLEDAGGPKPAEVKLPLTTVDKIVDELGLSRVTFIKMDVEGAERNAIRGAARTIARFHPRLSLATENLDDDYIAVPQEVSKVRADYDVECGLCRRVSAFAFRPDVLFFIPR